MCSVATNSTAAARLHLYPEHGPSSVNGRSPHPPGGERMNLLKLVLRPISAQNELSASPSSFSVSELGGGRTLVDAQIMTESPLGSQWACLSLD